MSNVDVDGTIPETFDNQLRVIRRAGNEDMCVVFPL